MLPRNHPDRIQIAFDDPRLVANAGLLLPVTLAQHLGLREVVDSHVDLGDAPGRANPGDKLLTLVASALAGGDFIDDADVLRTGGTAGAIGCVGVGLLRQNGGAVVGGEAGLDRVGVVGEVQHEGIVLLGVRPVETGERLHRLHAR